MLRCLALFSVLATGCGEDIASIPGADSISESDIEAMFPPTPEPTATPGDETPGHFSPTPTQLTGGVRSEQYASWLPGINYQKLTYMEACNDPLICADEQVYGVIEPAEGGLSLTGLIRFAIRDPEKYDSPNIEALDSLEIHGTIDYEYTNRGPWDIGYNRYCDRELIDSTGTVLCWVYPEYNAAGEATLWGYYLQGVYTYTECTENTPANECTDDGVLKASRFITGKAFADIFDDGAYEHIANVTLSVTDE